MRRELQGAHETSIRPGHACKCMSVLVSSFETPCVQGGVGSRRLCIAPTQRCVDLPRVFALDPLSSDSLSTSHARAPRDPSAVRARSNTPPHADGCVQVRRRLTRRLTSANRRGERTRASVHLPSNRCCEYSLEILFVVRGSPSPRLVDASAAARALVVLGAFGNRETRCRPRRSVRAHRPSQSRPGGVRGAGARKCQATEALDVRVAC